MPDKIIMKPFHCPANGKICVGKTCKVWSVEGNDCSVLLIESRLAVIGKALTGIEGHLETLFEFLKSQRFSK